MPFVVCVKVFRLVENRGPRQYSVRISLIEIYNETVRDLLCKSASQTSARPTVVCSRPCGVEAVPYCCVSNGTVSSLDDSVAGLAAAWVLSLVAHGQAPLCVVAAPDVEVDRPTCLCVSSAAETLKHIAAGQHRRATGYARAASV